MAETEAETDSESYKKLCRLWDHVRDIEYDREFYRVNDVEKINREMEKIIEKSGDNNYQFSSDDVITKRNPQLAGCTALHLAAGQNNDTIINVLLSKPGIDFTVKNHNGSTALHAVVEKYYKSRWRSIKELSENNIVKALVSAHLKFNVFHNPCNKDGISHFHVACMINNTAAIEFFVSKGVSVNQVVVGDFSQFLGYTPLHFAVDCCARETVEVLLRSGADVDKKDTKGMSPVQLLLGKIMSNVDLIHAVMSFVDMMNTDSRHSDWRYKIPQLMADVEADKQIMELLLSHMMGLKKPLELEDLSVFHIACILQNTTSIEQLLTEIEDINHCVKMDSTFCPGYTAVHFAAHFDPKIMKFLTQHGASIESKDANKATPLDICLEKYKVQDLHCILSSNPLWRDLLVSDNKTKLLDVIFAMKDSNTLEGFLKGVESYQSLRVPNDSPLWPGYTLLHLAVNFSETIKIFTDYERNDGDYYENAVFEKLEREYIERIEVCMKHGADIRAQDAHGRTALHLAYRLQKAQVVRLLLEQHTDEIVNSIDDDNLSHLYIACAFNYPRAVEKLLAHDESNVNLTIKCTFEWPRNHKYHARRNIKKLPHFFVTIGSTPLHVAVTTGSPELVGILLEHGADVNARDSNGVTPLHRTLACENPSTVGQILLSSPDLEECSLGGLNYLHLAAEFGSDEKVIDRLIALGADVNSAINFETEVEDDLLCLAYYCDHRRHLSEPFAFMARHNKSRPVDRAIYRNHTVVVGILLERGVDILAVGPHDRTLLHEALRGGYCSHVILSAIKRNVDLQQRVREVTGITMLHLACNECNLKDLEYQLENGVDVNEQVKFDSPVWPGCTAMHVLTREIFWSYRRISNDVNINVMMNLLLANGADVTLLDAEENTPIHVIFTFDYYTTRFSFAELLLERAANSNVNPVDADGVSHFHIACLRNNLSIMEKFLRHNVDVNQSVALHSSRFPGCSPLHLVLQSDSRVSNDVRIEAIDLLIRYGADVHAKDLYGNTAFHAVAKCAPPRKQLLEKIFSIGTDIKAKNVFDEEPLGMLMSSRKFEYADIKFFLERNCHPNLYDPRRDEGCLTFLFANDHPIRKIVKAPSITTIDDMGRNAIHNIVSWEWARTKSYYQIIPMLMMRGCNIDHKDNLGRTPLHLAVKFNNSEAVKDLLGAGADINVTNAEGESPFSHAFPLLEYSWNEIVISMAIHIRKLQITGLHVSDLNSETMEELLKNHSLDEEKIKGANGELAKMKNLKIESTPLSPFDFFSETGVIVNFPHMPLSEQQAIDEFFTSMKKRDFPELGYLLKIRYEKALKSPGCLCFFGKKLIRTAKLLRSKNRKFCV